MIILAELIQKKVKNYDQITLINISNNKFKKVKWKMVFIYHNVKENQSTKIELLISDVDVNLLMKIEKHQYLNKKIIKHNLINHFHKIN
ncbi:hypothetical protein SPE_0408 [Spiroplasma eriocheiris CCTCC M 207170]|nr:hypothetical protein SPE_0408 [Spiroplasma eriocheiris CCTCC M 207170]